MSTRACYTFRDTDGECHHVYKHNDGYPEGALAFLRRAFTSGLAWPLPRYEADEAAAAFVAANKNEPGGVRLSHGPDSHGDIEYHYTIYQRGNVIMVEVAEANPDKILSDSPLETACETYEAWRDVNGAFTTLKRI